MALLTLSTAAARKPEACATTCHNPPGCAAARAPSRGLFPTISRVYLLLPVAVLLVFLVPRPALAQGDVPRFEPAPCPVAAPADVQCGYLTVWEDRADASQGTIRLAVAILPGQSTSLAPDPVVYLEGGPGGSALEGLSTWLDSPLRTHRNFILFEQRGTEYDTPDLECPELKQVYVDTWAAGLDDTETAAQEVAAASRCHDRLVAQGADLAAYNSAVSAADLEDLRQALGYPSWNLYGISYGTRLALTAMRDYPAGIRSVILDSVYPPQVDGLADLPIVSNRVLDRLFAGCAADPACSAAYPDLEAEFYDVWARANEQPFEVRVPHPDTGEMLTLPVAGDDLVGELFLGFYDSSVIPYLPLVIDRLAAGNEDVLFPLTDFALSTYLQGSEGMNLSVTCHEEAPFTTLAQIVAAQQSVPPPMRAFEVTSTLEICDFWGAGTASPVEDEPVTSDVPALVLEGAYDPITPPSYGQATAATLSNSYYFEFPGLGHGTTLADCPAQIAADFLGDPTTRPPATCLSAMRPPNFRIPGDLYVTSASYRLLLVLDSGSSRLLIPLLLFVTFFLLVLAYVTLHALLRLFRVRSGAAAPTAGWMRALIAAVALLNLIFLAGISLAFVSAMFGDWTILIFGLPPWAGVVLAIPVASALLTVALLVLLAVAWLRRDASPARRVAYTLVLLGTIAFYAFLFHWHLVVGLS